MDLTAEPYTWEKNVKNCHVDVERSVIITENIFDAPFQTLDAGAMLGNLGLTNDQYALHHCGKWFWIEFKDKEIAMAFKLRWI